MEVHGKVADEELVTAFPGVPVLVAFAHANFIDGLRGGSKTNMALDEAQEDPKLPESEQRDV